MRRKNFLAHSDFINNSTKCQKKSFVTLKAFLKLLFRHALLMINHRNQLKIRLFTNQIGQISVCPSWLHFQVLLE